MPKEVKKALRSLQKVDTLADSLLQGRSVPTEAHLVRCAQQLVMIGWTPDQPVSASFGTDHPCSSFQNSRHTSKPRLLTSDQASPCLTFTIRVKARMGTVSYSSGPGRCACLATLYLLLGQLQPAGTMAVLDQLRPASRSCTNSRYSVAWQAHSSSNSSCNDSNSSN